MNAVVLNENIARQDTSRRTVVPRRLKTIAAMAVGFWMAIGAFGFAQIEVGDEKREKAIFSNCKLALPNTRSRW